MFLVFRKFYTELTLKDLFIFKGDFYYTKLTRINGTLGVNSTKDNYWKLNESFLNGSHLCIETNQIDEKCNFCNKMDKKINVYKLCYCKDWKFHFECFLNKFHD